MTVPSTARRAGPYTGNGSTTTFSFTFKTFAAGDLQVTRMDTLGIETTLVLNSDYSVSLNVDQDASPGGTITYPITGSPLPAGHKLTIVGDLEYEQTTDLLGGGAFNARVIEDTFDRTVIQIQQLEERLDRALLVPVNSTANVQLPNPEANELIGWDSTGSNLANYSLSQLSTGIAYGTMRFDTFTGNGSQTQFALTEDPAALANLDVSISGVTQIPGTDYTLTSATIVFTSAPPNGAAILARYGRALPVSGPIDSSAVTHVGAGSGAQARTVQAKLRQIVDVKDFGAVGDGSADDTDAIQDALDYLGTVGGGDLIIQGGLFRSRFLVPSRNTTIVIRPDATLYAIKQSSNNLLFVMGAATVSSTSLTTALTGTTQITVADTSTFSVDDAVFVSAGTYTGAAPERGPTELNTIKSIDSSTTMTLDLPLRYSYTAFGLPGQAPEVINLGNKNSVKRGIRVTGGGKISPDPITAFNSYYFSVRQAIDLQIDNIVFENLGAGILGGGVCVNLRFLNCTGYGRVFGSFTGSPSVFNVATMCQSKIAGNILQFDLSPSGTSSMVLYIFEVGCVDNIISDNIIGPVTGIAGPGIGFSFNSFGNIIANNLVYGRSTDVAAGVSSLGIRTFQSDSALAIQVPGNVITGNTIRNIMTAIGDANPRSVIANNQHFNDSLHPFSITFQTTSSGSDVVAVGNSSYNIQRPSFLNTGVAGGFSILSGTVSPASDWGAVGSMYLKKNGDAGQTVWFREPQGGSPAWLPRNQLPSVTFANVGSPANGTMLYVSDGTAGSSPLTGGGTGCVAIRQNGAWKGL